MNVQRQRGFSVVEVIMAVVIVGLAGAVGWMFIQNATKNTKTDNTSVKNSIKQDSTKKTQSPATPTTTPVANSQSPKPSPTVAIKTYKSPHWNLAFDYPASWTLTDNPDHDYVIDADADIDYMLLKSPSGFKLYFDSYLLDGLGGACGPDGPSKINNITFYGESGLSGIYAVSYSDAKNSSSFHLHLSQDKTNETLLSDCLGRETVVTPKSLNIKTNQGKSVQILFHFTNMGSDGKSQQKPNSKELTEAAAILKSLRKI